MKIKKIAIVGGGTAGWLAANHLGVELCSDPNIEITLIESKDVPVIGVGEGTVPYIKTTLKKFGIKEVDLLCTCDATFKQGIKFENWLDTKKNGENNFYYHPFSSPYPKGYDVTNYWLHNRESLDFSELSDTYSVSESNKSPKEKSSAPYSGLVDYAYHFNAAKFSNLLAKNAIDKFSVKHKHETIRQVELDQEGFIEKLIYETGEEEQFDFFIDCSGFSALLVEKALKFPFVDKSKQILTDSAFVLQVPSDAKDEIVPYTLARAHDAGWIWDIPLTTRRGVGFVYSSQYMSEDHAVQSFSQYLQQDVEQSELRKISMKIGYRDSFWEKNCAVLGLAQGFVEPLEATSILVTDFSANLLSKNFPKYKEDIEISSSYCNKAVKYTWERVIDFVQLHYLISDRKDSEFWRANISNTYVSDVLAERLAMWRITPPKKSDFFSSFDIFGVENYLFVVYGMKYSTRLGSLTEKAKKQSKELIDEVHAQSELMSKTLLSHRQWLSELKTAYELMVEN